jgi:hypothetical protein
MQNGLCHIAGNSLAGANVHSQSRGGVNFDHHAVNFPQGLRNIGGDDINPGNVEADNFGDALCNPDVGRVNIVGAVDGNAAGAQVGGGSQVAHFAFR